jgi:hypothetical protein
MDHLLQTLVAVVVEPTMQVVVQTVDKPVQLILLDHLFKKQVAVVELRVGPEEELELETETAELHQEILDQVAEAETMVSQLEVQEVLVLLTLEHQQMEQVY